MIHDAFYMHARKAIAMAPHFLMSCLHMVEKLFDMETTKRTIAILTIITVCYIGFTKSDRYFATTDALPNNLATLNILFNDSYDITNLQKSLDKKDLKGIYVQNSEDIVYPKTSVFLGIAGIPAFRFLHWMWGVEKLDNETFILSPYSQYFGKFYASFLSALSAAFMYLILRFQKVPHARSFGLALVYAFCTNVFNIAAQSNIQHAISLFLVTGATALFFWKPKNALALVVTGFIIGISTQIRISNGFYALFFAYMIHPSLRRINFQKLVKYIYFIGGFAIGYGLLTWYLMYHSVPNGYQDEITFSLKILTPQLFLQNAFGLLFSYNYGLFIFSPIFIVLLIALITRRRIAKDYQDSSIASIMTIAVFISFAASWWMWSGGLSLGARLIIEAIPLGIMLIAYYYDSLSEMKSFYLQVWILIVISFYINILTAFSFDKTWHDKYTKPGHESQMRNAWYTDPPLLVYMMHHQYYFNEQLVKKDDRIFVEKSWIWFNAYDRQVKEIKKIEIPILPIKK